MAGGDFNEIAYIQQQVIVPTGSPYLAYWHWIASADSCGNDFGGVIINGSTVVDAYNLCTSTNTGGWAKHVVNLSAYAGQTVSLQIRAETNGSLNSSLFVDDVSFQSSPTVLKSSQPDNPPSINLEEIIAPKPERLIPGDVDRESSSEYMLGDDTARKK